ncbi:MATE family efflux transporter [Bacillus sp. AGMB 02131]|uniref:Probable multidrug resistance protein NorM n=1 Tax=Peribacillus faecalis TaxID=2772559 RepID=A0A927CZ78_9BACI|nr:MATE family efflux transporter [Peribacillus faecalis]MBD3109804.1 MATE family efflux transporter [Peribacillus faecalis]
MNITHSKKEKLKLFITIMLPVLITQVGMFAMTFFDTVMSGNYGSADLAGVAIGSSIWTPVYTGLSGILIAVTPIVSQLVGAGKEKKVPYSVTQGIYLSIILAAIVLAIGSIVLNPILNSMSLEPHVRVIAHDYLVALSWGIIPLFFFSVIRSFIDALGQTRVSMIITLVALPINVFFNYVLIFGKLGFPELGGIGSGYATAITYWIVLLIAFAIILKVKPFSTYRLFRSIVPFSWKECITISKIGVPIGLSIFFETSIFSAVTLLMSEYNTNTIAAHQTALNFSSLLYMVPLSISMALTILVGFEVGGKRYHDAKQYSAIGTIFAVSMAVLFAIVLYFFRFDIAAIYTKDTEVIKLAGNFLIFALCFQISDAIMAPIQGALRGYKDVNLTFILSFTAFWIIGLPVGYVFANFTSMGPYGYWVGLIVGLACGAISLAVRLIYIQKKKFAAIPKV